MEGSIKKIIAEAKNRGIVVQTVAKSKLDELSETKKHQGVIAFASAHKYAEVDDILKKAEEKGKSLLSSYWMVLQILIIWALLYEPPIFPVPMV